MKKIKLLLVCALVFAMLAAQHSPSKKFSPYTKVFTSLKNEEGVSNSRLKSLFRTKEINEKSYLNAFIRLNDRDQLDSLEAMGVLVNSRINNIITALVPSDQIDSLASIANVKRVEIGVPVHKRMNKARITANVDSVQLGKGLDQPYTGKGVVVGVVDQGFEYGHVNFYNSTRDTLRIKRVWNQNSTTGTNPADYAYGSEYATTSSILNAAFDIKDDTHGTHVAGIAAGSDTEQGYTGVAPKADLVLVSFNDDVSTSILDGVKYVYDYASGVSKPAVVNLSLGSHIGPHDGTSTFDQACDALQGAGRLLVGAAGNEGGDSIYIRKAFSSSKDTLRTFFKFVDSTSKTAYADIWGQAGKSYKVALGVYNTSTKKYTYISNFYNASATNEISLSLTKQSGSSSSPVGTLYIYTEKNDDNNKANAFVAVQMKTLPSTQHVCLLVTASEGYVDAWSETSYATFDAYSQSGWSSGGSASSVGEIGGTGTKIISVGAFVSNKYFTNTLGGTYSFSSVSETSVGDIANFSSKGPTADNRMKPDIAAPGSIITSSYSNAVVASSEYSSLLIAKTAFNTATDYYGVLQGTSMASPFVTGVLATWLEADPKLTPEDVRSIFQETAINDTYTGNVRSGGSPIWGYGKIDAWNGIKKVIGATSSIQGELQNSLNLFSLQQRSASLRFTFLRDAEDVVVSIYSLTGQEIYRKKIGSVEQNDENALELVGVAKGVYIIRMTGKDSIIQNQKIAI
jgi:subtilisin family serine protease